MDGACHREPLSECLSPVSGRTGSRHDGSVVLPGMDGSDRRSRAPQLLDVGESHGQRVLRRRRDPRWLGRQHVLRPGALPAAVQPPRRRVRHRDPKPAAPAPADSGWRPVRSLLVFTLIPIDLEVRRAARDPVAHRKHDHLGPRDLRCAAGALPGVCRAPAGAGAGGAAGRRRCRAVSRSPDRRGCGRRIFRTGNAGIAIQFLTMSDWPKWGGCPRPRATPWSRSCAHCQLLRRTAHYLDRALSSAMLILCLSPGSVSFRSMVSNAVKSFRSARVNTIAPFTSGSFSEEYAAISARSVDSSPPRVRPMAPMRRSRGFCAVRSAASWSATHLCRLARWLSISVFTSAAFSDWSDCVTWASLPTSTRLLRA